MRQSYRLWSLVICSVDVEYIKILLNFVISNERKVKWLVTGYYQCGKLGWENLVVSFINKNRQIIIITSDLSPPPRQRRAEWTTWEEEPNDRKKGKMCKEDLE